MHLLSNFLFNRTFNHTSNLQQSDKPQAGRRLGGMFGMLAAGLVTGLLSIADVYTAQADVPTADMLIGADGNQATTTNLYRVDPLTGAVAVIGSTGGTSFTGLAQDSYGNLIGSTSMGAPSLNIQSLVNIDPYNAAISNVVAGQPYVSLASSGVDVYGYGNRRWGPIPNRNKLLAIDSYTHAATLIGGNTQLKGIGIDSFGNLYGVTGSSLYTIDPYTGAATFVATVSPLSYNNLHDSTFAPDGSMRLLDWSRSTAPNSPSNLLTVDPLTGAVSSTLPLRMPAGGAIEAIHWARFADTDGDGMPDFWETAYGLNPADPADATLDPDADGLNNLGEFQHMSDPHNPDTDGDGLLDGEEVNTYGTSPASVDTDGDGVQDKGEVAIGRDPLVATSVNAGFVSGVDQLKAVEDAAGRRHLVFTGMDANFDKNVFYAVAGPNGTLLPPVQLSTIDLVNNIRQNTNPDLLMDSAGHVHVTWNDNQTNVHSLLLDPSVAPMNGTPATLAALTLRSYMIPALGGHVHTALDAAGNLHVIGDHYGIRYAMIPANAGSNTAPGVIPLIQYATITNTSYRRESAGLAVDSNNNLHLVWADNAGQGNSALYYAMLGTSPIVTLKIAPSLIAGGLGGGYHRAKITVDAAGTVFIAAAHGAHVAGTDVFKLDPAAHPQDGTAIGANPVVAFGPVNVDAYGWIPDIAAASDGTLHVTVGSNSSTGSSSYRDLVINQTTGAVDSYTNLSAGLGGGSIYIATRADLSPNTVAWLDNGDTTLESMNLVNGVRVTSGPAVDGYSDIGTFELRRRALADLPAAALPAPDTFPLGMNEVVVSNVLIGSTVTVTLNMLQNVAIGSTYNKWDAFAGWTTFAYGSDDGDNQITLSLTDGGVGDADGIANGQIVDPGGFGPAALSGPVGGTLNPAGNGVTGGAAAPGAPQTAPGAAPAPVIVSTGGCAINPVAGFDPLLPLLLLLAGMVLAIKSSRQRRVPMMQAINASDKSADEPDALDASGQEHRSVWHGAGFALVMVIMSFTTMLAPQSAQAANVDMLIGADGNLASTTNLYRIDPLTGAVAVIGSTGGTSFTGLAQDSYGNLIGSTSMPVGAINSQSLVNVDPYNAAISNVVAGQPYVSLASSGVDVYGYGNRRWGPIPNRNKLLAIDSYTHAATLIGGNTQLNGIGMDTYGNLYGVINASLYTIDPYTGAATFVTGVSPLAYNRLRDVTFAPDGSMRLLDFGRSAIAGSPSNLLTVDPLTGAVSSTLPLRTPAGGVIEAIHWARFADTDGDGMPDFWEAAYGLNPASAADAASDPDADGLNNLGEFQNMTDPNNPDTDGDGFLDGEEVNTYGTSPTNADTDGDGVQDKAEVAIGRDPLVAEVSYSAAFANGVDQLVAVEDAAGRRHIAFTGIDANFEKNVFYAVAGPNGTLLPPVQLSTTDPANSLTKNVNPDLLLDSVGHVHVTWGDNLHNVHSLLLDPSVAPMNGTQVALAALTLRSYLIPNLGGHMHTALDASDNLHVISTTGAINYAMIPAAQASGTFPAFTPVAGNTYWHTSGDLAVDSGGNVHLVWIGSNNGGGSTLNYAMLRTSPSLAFAIAPSTIAGVAGTGYHRAKITIDAAGTVFIAAAHGAHVAGTDVFRLNPGAHPQNGSTIGAAPVVVFGPVNVDGNGWIPDVAAASDGTLHVTVGSNSSTGSSSYRDLAVNKATGAVDSYTNLSAGLGGGSIYIATRADLSSNTVAWLDNASTTLESMNLVNGVRVTSGPAVDGYSDIGTFELHRRALADLPAAALPAPDTFPLGMNEVVVSNVLIGSTVTVTLNMLQNVAIGSTYNKWDAFAGWTTFAYGSDDGDNQITLSLTDGGVGDADGIANGQIVDPGGFGPAALSGPVGGTLNPAGNGVSGGTATPPAVAATPSITAVTSGGCAVNPASGFDPVMLLLLALAGIMLVRRRV